MRRDRGSVTLWVLGLTLLVIAPLGWLGVSMWAGFAERRELASAADLAARAGATALDTEAFRNGQGRRLDPDLAEQRAWDSLAAQNLGQLSVASVDATTTYVVVELERELGGLYNVLASDDEPVHAHVRAIARPQE